MVRPFDLTPLDSVDDETHIAVARKPQTVVMIVRLVAVGHVVYLDVAVSTKIEHCGKALLDDVRAVQIGRDVEPRK